MKCPFCDNELKEVPESNLRYCHQSDHWYEWNFDYMDGVNEVLKIDDKIYFGNDKTPLNAQGVEKKCN